MLFGILGPLLVRDGDNVVDVPAARQRVLLAVLLVHAGQPVPAGALAETMWDGSPPTGAAATLRTHVMRLRRALGPRPGARLVTRYPGYLLDAEEEEVDLLRFTCLCREGGAAVRAGAWAEASRMLSEALVLWRGAPLADIPSQMLCRDESPRLEQLHLQALEWRIDAELRLGCHGELVPELQALAARHPLQERFHAQLMLALYRCGRQAEALVAYQQARSLLVDDLGTEPGAELRELHQQILTADAVLNVPEPAPRSARVPVPIMPRELPAPVRHFVGRKDELAALTGLLGQAGHQMPGTVIISAIGGTAGVGKTALAVHWAHQVAERFPDGQLYVNLHGYDRGQPMTAADALAGFLRALGVPGQDVPAEAEERSARYRSLLAGRRMLIVLDNVGDVEQVRPLLPGTPTCVAIVTSRDSLAGLVARDGAQRLDLDLLPLAEAVGLLRALIGARVDADPASAAALAARCCRLPLALRVAAELAAASPAAPLAGLAGELADQQRRLDLLDAGGDRSTEVRAVLSWSYRYLDADAARAFRLLSLHAGADFGRYAAAAVTGTMGERARQILDRLARACLVQPIGPDRYGMHDLLRAYAAEQADTHDSADERRAALTRLFDHYLHTSAAAMDTLFPAECGRRPCIPRPTTPVPPVTDPAAALAWLDAERANLVAAARICAQGWPRHAIRLAATLFRYLDASGHLPEAVTIHSHAHRAAMQIGDRAAEAEALISLGIVDLHQGRYPQATRRFQQALALHHEARDRAGEARALHNLGGVDLYQGRYPQATRRFQQALALHHEFGDRAGEARALGHLGALDLLQGRYLQAARHLEPALALCRETGDQAGEARALGNLGGLDLRQGRYRQAATRYRQALALCREFGDRASEAEALNGLGEVLLATGQPGRSRTEHAAALGLASQTGDQYEQARAHNGLARACHAIGDPGQARRHWQEALTLYTDLGAPEADQVRTQLTMADNDDHREP